MIESEGCGGNRSSAPGFFFLKVFLLRTFASTARSCLVCFFCKQKRHKVVRLGFVFACKPFNYGQPLSKYLLLLTLIMAITVIVEEREQMVFYQFLKAACFGSETAVGRLSGRANLAADHEA